MLTNRGFDHENNAPDKANETQSTGVPESENNNKFISISIIKKYLFFDKKFSFSILIKQI